MGDELHLIRAAQDNGRRAAWTALPAMDQAPTMSDIPTCFCRRSDAFLTCACGGCTGVPVGLTGPSCGFGSQWNPGHGAAYRGHRHRRRRGRLARNDHLCQMLGYPWEELRTKDWTQDHPP